MSDNKNILDILNDIDNDMISEASVINKRRPQRIIIRFITVSAAVLVFIFSAITVKNGFFDTDYILPSEDPFSSENTTDNSENSTETPSVNDITEISTSAVISEFPSEGESETDNFFIEPSTTELFQEPLTDSPIVEFPIEEPGEITTEADTTGSVTGEIQPVIFIETNFINLISASADSLPVDFPVTEKTDINTLEKIYGTKILPSYIPEINTGFMLNGIKKEEYPVHYNEDKTEAYCNNSFAFVLNNGSILRIHTSTHPLTLLDVENENRHMASDIGNTPVLLFKGKESDVISIYSAYFEKDGCYFRIQLSGILISESEFIKIIESLI